jgi:hypothetical protein
VRRELEKLPPERRQEVEELRKAEMAVELRRLERRQKRQEEEQQRREQEERRRAEAVCMYV